MSSRSVFDTILLVSTNITAISAYLHVHLFHPQRGTFFAIEVCMNLFYMKGVLRYNALGTNAGFSPALRSKTVIRKNETTACATAHLVEYDFPL